MVQDKVGAGLEASFSHNTRKHQTGESSIGVQCVVSHAQSMVEVPYGCFGGLGGNVGGVE